MCVWRVQVTKFADVFSTADLDRMIEQLRECRKPMAQRSAKLNQQIEHSRFTSLLTGRIKSLDNYILEIDKFLDKLYQGFFRVRRLSANEEARDSYIREPREKQAALEQEKAKMEQEKAKVQQQLEQEKDEETRELLTQRIASIDGQLIELVSALPPGTHPPLTHREAERGRGRGKGRATHTHRHTHTHKDLRRRERRESELA